MAESNQFELLVQQALDGPAAEIAKTNAGEEAIDDIHTLNFMSDRLRQILANFSSGASLDDDRFRGSMGHIVVDRWRSDSALGQKICQAEYLYERSRAKK